MLLAFAIALSPVLVIGGVSWSGQIEREAARRQEMMTLVAEEAAHRAEDILASAPSFLKVIDALAPGDICSSGRLAEVMRTLPRFNAVGVVDENGRTQCTTIEGGEGSTAENREWFLELRDTGADFVQSTAYFGPVSKTWILASAKRRTNPDGSFGGAIVIGVPVASLAYSLERNGLPEGGEIALVDKSGRVFASEHWSDTLPPEVATRLDSNRRGFFAVRTDQGQERDIAIVPLTPAPFFSVLSAPKLSPTALENVSAFSNFALPLLAWVLALATAWLATDRLVLRWLDYLRRIAGLYASGKLSVQPLRAKRAAPGEITVLADTMEEMAVRVRDRTTRLEAAVSARDAAMKEIHHRVKNNLQIINSLLSLQSRKVRDPAAIAVLDDARARINALSLIHRSLYEHNDIRKVDVKSFFGELVTQLDHALGAEEQRIKIESYIDEDTIDADIAVPLALFTAEAVTNAVKHAFPSGRPTRGGRVTVNYRVGEAETALTIEDDGIGDPETEKAAGVGIGGMLMSAFARQVHGELDEGRSPSGGRLMRVRIPRVGGVTGAPSFNGGQGLAK